MAAFTAAGTSYATHGEPMVPIYVFYSMFGFQRTGDSIWAAADQMARGFLIGATAGRTTLTGEGLQHADGHSPLLAATNPAVVSYDPAYAYEIAHIVQDGLRRMYGDDPENVIYYLTVYNEPMRPAARSPRTSTHEGILRGHVPARPRAHRRPGRRGPRGCSCSRPVSACRGRSRRRSCCATTGASSPTSGRSPRGASCAATAWLRRAGVPAPRAGAAGAVRHPAAAGRPGPVVAVSDYMRQVQDQIGPWVPGDFASLGADGFGFSDTRPAARRFFHIDGPSVAVRALQMLAKRGEIDPSDCAARRPSATACSTSRPAPPATPAASPSRRPPMATSAGPRTPPAGRQRVPRCRPAASGRTSRCRPHTNRLVPMPTGHRTSAATRRARGAQRGRPVDRRHPADGDRPRLVPRPVRRGPLVGRAGRPGRHRRVHRAGAPRPGGSPPHHRRRVRHRPARADPVDQPGQTLDLVRTDRRRGRGRGRRTWPRPARSRACARRCCATRARSRSPRPRSTPRPPRPAAPGTRGWSRSSSTPSCAARPTTRCSRGRPRSAGARSATSRWWPARRRTGSSAGGGRRAAPAAPRGCRSTSLAAVQGRRLVGILGGVEDAGGTAQALADALRRRADRGRPDGAAPVRRRPVGAGGPVRAAGRAGLAGRAAPGAGRRPAARAGPGRRRARPPAARRPGLPPAGRRRRRRCSRPPAPSSTAAAGSRRTARRAVRPPQHRALPARPDRRP